MDILSKFLSLPTFDQSHAYQMGMDCAKNGANETNCHFRLFSSPEMTKAWEQGKRDAEKQL